MFAKKVGESDDNKVGNAVATDVNLKGTLVGDTVGESDGNKVGYSDLEKAVGDVAGKELGSKQGLELGI